jgi:hypothetical protein
MAGSFEEIGRMAALVRTIELERVLPRLGCTADRADKAKWHTPRGVISVTGAKFMNWTRATGGGGAIDLVLHLSSWDFKTTVRWLSENFAVPRLPAVRSCPVPLRPTFSPPPRHEGALPRLRQYLLHERCLPASLIEVLLRSGRLYADPRANAVFVLWGKDKTVVGAELRGTSGRKWHALAPGSRKDQGFFSVSLCPTRTVVLCESGIDALSFLALDRACGAISTSGAHPDPAWLPALLAQGFQLSCGFDADETGDSLAARMIQRYPQVRRLRPPLHDWNDVLKATGACRPLDFREEDLRALSW